jgi:capsular polysaccharide biosynthesis protein
MPIIQTNYPVNIQAEDEHIFDIAQKYFVPEPSLIIYKHCWWHLFKGKELKGPVEKFKYLIASLVRISPIKKINNAAWVIDSYSKNYFHWINDVLPKISFLQLNNPHCPVIIPAEFSNYRYIEDSLKLLNVSYLLLPQKGICIINRLLLPKLGASGCQDPFYFPLVQKQLKTFTNRTNKKKLFISRQKATTRNIVSSREIEKIMNRKGIEIVYPEMLTFKQQIDLFSSASHLIGVHGAGLTNMIFMNSGSRVLEIRRNDDVINFCYYFLAGTCHLKYYYFMGQSAGVSDSVQGDNILMDLNNFRQTLDIFLDPSN